MEFLLGLIGLAAVVVVAVWAYIKQQGECDLVFVVDQRSDFALVQQTEDVAVFSCVVPFVNQGPQDGTIMDCFTRHLLPFEQYDGVQVLSRIELETARRTDGYFEALIVPKGTGQAMVVTVQLTATGGDIREALRYMVDMPVEIYCQIVGRGDWYVTKTRLVMTREEIAAAAGITLAE